MPRRAPKPKGTVQIPAKRTLKDAPVSIIGQHLDDLWPKLQQLARANDGIQDDLRNIQAGDPQTPSTVRADVSGTAGTGALPALEDHVHYLSTGAVAALANTATDGTSPGVARADHQHKRDVRVMVTNTFDATRNAIRFDVTSGLAITASDDSVSDRVRLTLGLSYVPLAVSVSAGNTAGTPGLVSSGTLYLAGGNNVTLSQNGQSVTISGPTLTNSAWTVSDAATSGTVARLAFTNLNGVTLSLSSGAGGSHTIVGSHNALTTAAQSNHSHGDPTLALTNLTGTTASASNGLTLSLSAANQNVTAANGGFAFQTLSFSNAQGVSFITSAGSAIAASVETSYAASNHSHGNPTLALTNLTGTTASASNGFTLSLSAAAPGAGGDLTISDSATSTASNVFTLGAASNNITLYIDTDSTHVVGSYQNLVQAAGVVDHVTYLSFQDAPDIVFSATGILPAGQLKVHASLRKQSFFQNVDEFHGTQSQSYAISTNIVFPFMLPYPLSGSWIQFPNSYAMGSTTVSTATSAASRGAGFSMFETANIVLYSRGVDASSQSLQSVFSTSKGFTMGFTYSIAGNGTQMSSVYAATFDRQGADVNFATSVSESTNSYRFYSSVFSNFGGLQWSYLPFATALSVGQWWLAVCRSTATSTSGSTFAALTNYSIAKSLHAISQVNALYGFLGSTSNSTMHLQPGLGSWTTNSHGRTTGSIAMSQISTSASHNLPYFQIHRIA